MLAPVDERSNPSRPERVPNMTFWGSLLMRALPTGLCLWGAWAFNAHEIVEDRPWAHEIQLGMTLAFLTMAAAIIIVGIVQYRNGTFQD